MTYKLLPEEPKQPLVSAESLHRLPAQAAKGVGATLAGATGDILSLPYAGVNKLVTALGGESVPYEKSFLGKAIPTTQTHIQNLEEGIPYLKPKNKIESFVNDVASDATSIVIPGGALTKAGLRGASPARGFLTSLGANSAGSFVSDITGDPEKGSYVKMGAMFLLSALNKPKANAEVGNLYKKADSLLPQNATVNARRLETDMMGLKNRVLNGRTVQDLAPSEKFVIEEADKILRQIDPMSSEANVSTLRSALRSLNENLTKMVYDAPDKASKVRARKLAKQVNHSVNNTLEEYGKVNPEWWKAHKSANEGFATLAQSNFITNFIENNVKSGTFAHGLLHLFGVATGAALLPAYQTAKIAYRISKSPTLAKHYARVVSSAAAEDATTMRKELHSMDKALEKEEEKKPKYRLED